MQGFHCIYPPIYSTKSDRKTHNFKGNSASHFVGYNTIAVPADQLYAYGVQFTEVSGITELAIKDLLTVDKPKGAAKIGDNADQMWVWSGSSWKKYFYSSGRGSKVTGWCAEDNVVEITPDKIGVGQGFFFRRASSADGTLTFVKPAGL